MTDLEKLKFPIGEYEPNRNPDAHLLKQWIKDIQEFPSKVEALTEGISIEQLNWNYRPDGWSLKQVIHHCADSHINSITRFKLALTEDTPTIRPYDQDLWIGLIDANDDNIQNSIYLLKGLHSRWTVLLKSLSADQLQLEYVHPEHGAKFNLAETIGSYAWHCNHHYQHLVQGLKSFGSTIGTELLS